jgi:hypothetical protein
MSFGAQHYKEAEPCSRLLRRVSQACLTSGERTDERASPCLLLISWCKWSGNTGSGVCGFEERKLIGAARVLDRHGMRAAHRSGSVLLTMLPS